MDSSDKLALCFMGVVLVFLLAMIAGGMHSSMLKHSCNLHGMQQSYDSAHIAQICGK